MERACSQSSFSRPVFGLFRFFADSTNFTPLFKDTKIPRRTKKAALNLAIRDGLGVFTVPLLKLRPTWPSTWNYQMDSLEQGKVIGLQHAVFDQIEFTAAKGYWIGYRWRHKKTPWVFTGREPRRASVSSPSEGDSIESFARHSVNFKFNFDVTVEPLRKKLWLKGQQCHSFQVPFPNKAVWHLEPSYARK